MGFLQSDNIFLFFQIDMNEKKELLADIEQASQLLARLKLRFDKTEDEIKISSISSSDDFREKEKADESHVEMVIYFFTLLIK